MGDRRERMIAETNAFLTWAVRTGAEAPRIPTRRVDSGGFAQMCRVPSARAAVCHWWTRTLNWVGSLGDGF